MLNILYFFKSPQPINFNATISAPHMHAFALEYLKDHCNKSSKILDVGSGSGYLYIFIIIITRTVAFSKMMDDEGLVVGIEHIPQLYELGVKNISKNHSNLIKDKKIILLESDGRLGALDYAPYNCIHVGAAAETIPEDLVKQLAPGGRMMIPVGKQNDDQYIYLIDKDSNSNVTSQAVLGVRYVPLTSKEKQLYQY